MHHPGHVFKPSLQDISLKRFAIEKTNEYHYKYWLSWVLELLWEVFVETLFIEHMHLVLCEVYIPTTMLFPWKVMFGPLVYQSFDVLIITSDVHFTVLLGHEY